MLSLEVDAHPDSSRYANTALSPKQVPTTVSAGLRVSRTAGPGVTCHRRPRATNGGKYRVSSKAGRASPGPAKNFESESAPRLWLRPELRGLGEDAAPDPGGDPQIRSGLRLPRKARRTARDVENGAERRRRARGVELTAGRRGALGPPAAWRSWVFPAARRAGQTEAVEDPCPGSCRETSVVGQITGQVADRERKMLELPVAGRAKAEGLVPALQHEVIVDDRDRRLSGSDASGFADDVLHQQLTQTLMPLRGKHREAFEIVRSRTVRNLQRNTAQEPTASTHPEEPRA